MRKKEKQIFAFRFKRWARKKYAAFNSLHKVVTIGVLATTCSLSASAQTTKESDSRIISANKSDVEVEQSDTLETVFVTQAINAEALFSSTINAEKIQQTAVQNSQDLLHYTQGVDLRARGTEGVQADISLKGGTFDQARVYLDQANLTDPQTGHYSLNIPLNLNDIYSVEVSDYNTGSVRFNSIRLDRSKATIQLSGGQYGYYQAVASGGLTNRKQTKSIYLSAGKTASDGYTYNTDFDITNLYLKAFTKLGTGSLSFQSGYQQKAYGANSFYSPAYKDQYEQIGCFISSLQYQNQWQKLSNQTTVYYRRQHDEFTLFRYEKPDWYTGNNYHLTDVIGATSQLDYRWNALQSSFLSADYRYEHIYSSNLGEPLTSPKDDPYTNLGVFYYGKARQHGSLTLGHHFSQSNRWSGTIQAIAAGNTDFGINFYGRADGAYHFSKKIIAGFYVQNSYRLPTFTDLYYTSPTQQGNTDLNPEKIFSTGLNFTYKPNRWEISLNPFYRYGFELIDWVRLPLEAKWHSENLTDIQTLGIDASLSYHFAKNSWIKQLEFNYIYLTQSQNSNEYLSLYATDYLRHQAKLTVAHKIYKSLSASWLFSFQDRLGTYLDFDTKQETPYKPYLLCDLRLAWDFRAVARRGFTTIFAEASNLFNIKYQDIGNIEQPGIWVKMGVKVRL